MPNNKELIKQLTRKEATTLERTAALEIERLQNEITQMNKGKRIADSLMDEATILLEEKRQEIATLKNQLAEVTI